MEARPSTLAGDLIVATELTGGMAFETSELRLRRRHASLGTVGRDATWNKRTKHQLTRNTRCSMHCKTSISARTERRRSHATGQSPSPVISTLPSTVGEVTVEDDEVPQILLQAPPAILGTGLSERILVLRRGRGFFSPRRGLGGRGLKNHHSVWTSPTNSTLSRFIPKAPNVRCPSSVGDPAWSWLWFHFPGCFLLPLPLPLLLPLGWL